MTSDQDKSGSIDERRIGGSCASPALRLTDHGAADNSAARRAVASENHNASLNARLSPGDPVWAFASQAMANMQGSILLPERRERLLQSAQRMGVQRFDANLVVALVQERARRGETIDPNDGVLSLVGMHCTHRDLAPTRAWVLWVAALLLAAILAVAMLSALSV